MCLRAQNHPPASVKINSQSASRLVQKFTSDAFCMGTILPAEFKWMKRLFKAQSFSTLLCRGPCYENQVAKATNGQKNGSAEDSSHSV